MAPVKTTPFRAEKRYGDEELRELREALEQGSLFYAHGKKVKQLESRVRLDDRLKLRRRVQQWHRRDPRAP